MAQQEVESAPETLLHSASAQSSDPSLSRNVSFSKLNAQAAEFVPSRPQQPPPPAPPPRPAVIPPPPPSVMRIYPPPPPPPPPAPFRFPIHSPIPLPNVIPVQNHHHHHHHQEQHHLQQTQYVQARNHNNHRHSQNSQYVAVQFHTSNRHHHLNQYKKTQSDEEREAVGNKHGDATASDYTSKHDKNGLSDEAIRKLLNQVEYYFSDLNLATTDHLMRFINKDPEGYVPIYVVASFKKVKAAIDNNSQLATVLRNSSKLVVSEDGKKVRRQHPLTESDVEELQSRVIVAENLPEDHCHQNLMKIFGAVGSVKTIRTCPPQTSGNVASSASRSAKADGMHFSNKLHAFVEYESIEVAEKAVAELNDERNWRSGLRVQLMLNRISKPAQARGKKGHNGQGLSGEDEVSSSEQMPNEKQTEDASQQYDSHSHDHLGQDHGTDKEGAQKKGRNKERGKGRGRPQYHHNHNNHGNHMGTPTSNNLVIGEQPTMTKQPPGPRMPDGTRGFSMGRGKPIAVNII